MDGTIINSYFGDTIIFSPTVVDVENRKFIESIYFLQWKVQLRTQEIDIPRFFIIGGRCVEVYHLKYYFERHLIYKWQYYRQTIFNQLNIMVSYVDLIGLCHSIVFLWEIYVMRHKCHVSWLCFHLSAC